MKVTVEHEITEDRLDDLVVTALESPPYWHKYLNERYNGAKDGWILEVLKGDGFKISNGREEKEDSSDYKEGVLNMETAHKALKLMAKDYPEDLADFINENEDAITGDIFLQLAILGDVIYG